MFGHRIVEARLSNPFKLITKHNHKKKYFFFKNIVLKFQVSISIVQTSCKSEWWTASGCIKPVFNADKCVKILKIKLLLYSGTLHLTKCVEIEWHILVIRYFSTLGFFTLLLIRIHAKKVLYVEEYRF